MLVTSSSVCSTSRRFWITCGNYGQQPWGQVVMNLEHKVPIESKKAPAMCLPYEGVQCRGVQNHRLDYYEGAWMLESLRQKNDQKRGSPAIAQPTPAPTAPTVDLVDPAPIVIRDGLPRTMDVELRQHFIASAPRNPPGQVPKTLNLGARVCNRGALCIIFG